MRAAIGHYSWLRRMPNAAQESIEAQIGSQPIKIRVDVKKGHLEVRALLTGLFKPGKSLIVSAQTRIRKREEKTAAPGLVTVPCARL
jgi:hypothetical protein